MRNSFIAGLIAVLAALAAPSIASATATYNFSVPVKVSGLVNGAAYQVACAVGTTTVPAPTNTAYNPNLMGGSYTGTIAVSVASPTPAHTYACQLFQEIGQYTWTPVGPTITGTM
jgi:hypothetical protein